MTRTIYSTRARNNNFNKSTDPGKKTHTYEILEDFDCCESERFYKGKSGNQPEKLHYIFFIWICLRNCYQHSMKKLCSTKQQIYQYLTPYWEFFRFFSSDKHSQSQRINKYTTIYTLPCNFSFG